MELRNIISFSKVAECKSFSKAANILGYSQSAITIQIKQLEENLSVKLFDRIGKKIYLTQKGKELLTYAYKILDLTNEASNVMKNDEKPNGELKIGVVESFCTSQFPNIIVECSKRFPCIELIVKIGTTPELVEMLNKNEVDIIITMDNKLENPNFITNYEQVANIYFISNSESPFINRKLKLKDIINESFIMPEKVCNCRMILEDMIKELNIKKELKIFLEIGNTEVIKKFVKKGLGISMLPAMTLNDDLNNNTLSILDVEDFNPNLWLQVLSHKNKYNSVVMKSFVNIIKENLYNESL